MQRYAANTPASSDPRKTTPKSFINRMKDRRGSNPSVTPLDFASEETDSKLGDDSKHGGTAFAYSFEDGASDHGKGQCSTALDNIVFVLLCATSFYYILIVPLQACFDWSSAGDQSAIFVLNYVADFFSLSANGRRLYEVCSKARATRPSSVVNVRDNSPQHRTPARSSPPPTDDARRSSTASTGGDRVGPLPTVASGKVVTLADMSTQSSEEHERRKSIFSRETCAVVFWPLVEFLAAVPVDVVLYATLDPQDAAVYVPYVRCTRLVHSLRIFSYLYELQRSPAISYSKAKFLFVITVFFLAAHLSACVFHTGSRISQMTNGYYSDAPWVLLDADGNDVSPLDGVSPDTRRRSSRSTCARCTGRSVSSRPSGTPTRSAARRAEGASAAAARAAATATARPRRRRARRPPRFARRVSTTWRWWRGRCTS